MKKFYSFLLLLLCKMNVGGQLLQQDFSSSTATTSYVSATPGNGQFNAISSSGAGTVVSINTGGANNKLRFDRTAGAQAGSFSRTTDLSPAPSTLMYQFDLSVTGTTTATTSVAVFQVGSGFGTANSAEATANTYARFTINTTTTNGTFQIRDITNGNNSGNIAGTTTILWVMNNSGLSQSYRAPDGSNESIGNDKADIWAGTTKLFDDVNIQTASQVITDLKFVLNAGSPIIDIDNILIDPVPPTTTTLPASGVTSAGFVANWNTVTGVTGYHVDVALDAGFTNFVSGFNDLYISGQAVSSVNLTGLMENTPYFYRVRPASQYTAGEFAGGNSDTRSVTTAQGSLPVTLLNFAGQREGANNILRWTTATENNNEGFEVQRSSDGINYLVLGFLSSQAPGGFSNDPLHYTFTDKNPAGFMQYYRLRQSDHGGRSKFSNIVLIRGGKLSVLTMSSLFPNPASTMLNIIIDTPRPGNIILIVSGVTGKTEMQKIIGLETGSNTMDIDISNLYKGIYFVKVIAMNNCEKAVSRFVKQ